LCKSMPELPEVETISRQLDRLIVGKKIKKVKVKLPKIVKAPQAVFRRALMGARIKNVSRRAKLLVFGLDNGWSMLVHLKMTGQLIFQIIKNIEQSTMKNRYTQKNRYTHVIFNFTDGSRLLFNDLRQFGYIKLVKTVELSNFFLKEGFGPEPLERDFTLADLKVLLVKKPKARIKQFLMDPKNIAGIGNIYSDEILFFSRIHPLRRVASLKPAEIKKIYSGIKKILPAAIKLKGTSTNDYLDVFGRPGKFAARLKVYGQEGKKCVKCKGRVVRIKIGGRSAHFCPVCQR